VKDEEEVMFCRRCDVNSSSKVESVVSREMVKPDSKEFPDLMGWDPPRMEIPGSFKPRADLQRK
jgi:hypothetical protein